MNVGKLFKMLVFERKTGQGPKDIPPEDICSAQSLEPQSFYFLLIFREYTREKFRLTTVIKSKALNQFEDFNVQDIRYRPEMKFSFHSVCFKQVLGHLSKSKVHAHISHSSNC